MLDPPVLQTLVREAITRHIDPVAWARAERRDARERAAFAELAATWPPKKTRT
jgi:hypothetical protein